MSLTNQLKFHKTIIFSVMSFCRDGFKECLFLRWEYKKINVNNDIGEVGDIRDDDGDDLIFSSVSLESLYMLSLSHKPQKFLKSISDFVQF